MEGVIPTVQAQGPVRTCCVCRRRLAKEELDRYVQGNGAGEGEQGLRADTAKRLPGRGIYVCRDPQCQDRFSRRKAARKKPKQGDGECR